MRPTSSAWRRCCDRVSFRVGLGFDFDAAGAGVEELDSGGDDVVALAALAVFGLPLVVRDAAVDRDAAALLEVLVAGFGELVPGLEQVRDAGYAVVNADCVLIGEEPRIARRRGKLEQTLTEIVGAPVSVRATTTDRLGFTGRGEGLAAQAVALLSG